MDILAQSVGLVGMTLGIVSLQMNTKKGILFLQTLCGVVFTAHFLLIGAYTGAVMNVVITFRSVVFYHKDKKWGASALWPWFFGALFIAAGAAAWEGPVTILLIPACLIQTAALYLDKPPLVRRFVWIASPFWLVYNFLSGSYGGIVTEILALASVFTAIYRYDIKPVRARRGAKAGVK